jgi:hypothetical protein
VAFFMVDRRSAICTCCLMRITSFCPCRDVLDPNERRNAEKFSAERFLQEFDALVQLRWAEFQASLGARA